MLKVRSSGFGRVVLPVLDGAIPHERTNNRLKAELRTPATP
jgi:hypothetical protein